MRYSLRRNRAFTLLEVMIAMGLFFMAIFAILELVSTNLRWARALDRETFDASSLLADLVQTNKLEEGVEYGDFGDLYPGYKWTRDIYLISTNGLFQADFLIHKDGRSAKDDLKMSIWLYRPQSINRFGPAGAVQPTVPRTSGRR